MKIHCLPAFQDNYIWILENGSETAVVDPGESQSVIQWSESNRKVINKILLTHHHSDHCGGVKDIKKRFRSLVYASSGDRGKIEEVDFWLQDNDIVDLAGERARVKQIPGHTPGHIAFWFEQCGQIFVGDTLFSLGCGKLFGGSPDQMWESLAWIKRLPLDTQIYCAHEYTLGNLKFVKHLFTQLIDNDFTKEKYVRLEKREKKLRVLRKENLPTVPFTLKEELETNPFLWCDEPDFIKSLPEDKNVPAMIFKKIRELKNEFH